MKIHRTITAWLAPLAGLSLQMLFVSPVASAQVVYVDANAPAGGAGITWADAFRNLQDALGVALPGDQVWVAEGTYHPDRGVGILQGDTSASFKLLDGVAIYGGFAGGEVFLAERDPEVHVTILSGDLAADDGSGLFADNSNNVVTYTGSPVGGESPPELDGFTICAGRADDVSLNRDGGGIRVREGSPVVRNCKIVDNQANNDGAGVHLKESQSIWIGCTFARNSGGNGGGLTTSVTVATFIDCVFEDNFAGKGGGVSHHGASTFEGCVFRNNEAVHSGGGIYNTGGSMILRDCIVVDNRATGQVELGTGDGGGLYDSAGSGNPVVERTLFVGNQAVEKGGGIYAVASPGATIKNCVVNGNSAPDGGGLYAYANGGSGKVRLVNCTIAGNTATENGGGVFYEELAGAARLELNDSIVWGNDVAGVKASELLQIHSTAGFPSVQYSCIQGWTGAFGGVGNMGLDPMLASIPSGSETDDLRLLPSSPCIDAGTPPPPVGLQGTDIAGNPRIIDGDLDRTARVDMGAHEYTRVQLAATEGPGGFYTLSITGDPSPYAWLGSSPQPGELFLSYPFAPDFGLILLDSSAWKFWRIYTGVPVQSPPLPLTGVLQVFVFYFTPSGSGWNLSNPVDLGEL